MLSIVDPCELKAPDIYRQARTVASKTSRATDGNWYRAPDDLPCQWHLWFDGGREVCSAIYSRVDQQWQVGPAVPLVNLTTGEGVTELLGEFLSSKYFSQPPKAIGIILHIADEFGLAEVAQAADSPTEQAEDFNFLRYNLIDDPREVLADREVSVEATSWRLLPFWAGTSWGQPRCVAVALSRSREAFLQKLLASGESMRLPIRVAVTSAPIEVLAALPLIDPAEKGGCLVAVPYFKFTAVFAVTPAGELRSVRSLTHRGGSLVPANFGDILWNMAVSAELAGIEGSGQEQAHPRVLVVSPNPQALKQAKEDLDAYSQSRQRIDCETIDLATHVSTDSLPGHRPEFLLYDPTVLDHVRSGKAPLAATTTFRALWDGWAKQSFMDMARLDTQYPTLADLRLLRLSTWFVGALALSMLATAAYGTFSLLTAMRHPSWNLTPTEISQTKAKHAKLLEEGKQIETTNKLLLPRSRGWVTIDFLLRMFPEDSGVWLDSYNYTVDVSRPPARGKGQTAEMTGLERKWSFKGLVKPKAMTLLSNLNSQRGLTSFFLSVAEATGDDSYAPDPSRQLTIALTQGRNSRFDSQAEPAAVARDPSLSFPFTFEATITQTLTEKDPLAIPLEKPL